MSHLLSVPRSPRYQSLDLWRGVACLAVVIYHSALYGLFQYDGVASRIPTSGIAGTVMNLAKHGREGVTLFFVISGYCIATTVDRSRRRPQPCKAYFERRLRRIYPPYWIAIALTAVSVALVSAVGRGDLFSHSLAFGNEIPSPAQLSIGQWLGNLSLIETWRRHLGGTDRFFLGHAWTLCYEEQFYAVFGLLLWLCPTRIFVGTLAVSVLTAFTYLLPDTLSVSGTFLDGRWLIFAIGIGVYYAINYAGKTARFAYVIGLLVVAALVKYLSIPNLATEFFVGSTFGALLVVLHHWDTPIARLKILQPLQFCGIICYSLYLVHWPVAKLTSHLLYEGGVTSSWQTLLVSVPVGVAASLLVAVPFHQLVERRFLNPSTHPQAQTTGELQRMGAELAI